MKNLWLFLTSCLIAAPLLAEVPVYRDQELVLDEAVTISAAGAHYYSNVRFAMAQDGSLSLISAEARPLAGVDAAELLLSGSSPVEVTLSAEGILSVPCVALEDPAVSRKGNLFSVVLAETVQAEGEVCVTIAAVTPFQIDIPLDVKGLTAGDYQVDINGILLDFTLDTDN